MPYELCGVCHQEILATQESVICPADRSPYHRECWDYNRGCGELGCIHNPASPNYVPVSPQQQVQSKQIVLPVQPSQQRSSQGWIIAAVVGVIVLVLICGVVLCVLLIL